MPGIPSVSVIIAARNGLRLLPRTIASIGPAPGAEIIVADDGSTDGTDAWLRELRTQDPRIVVLPVWGGGPARARNRAIAVASAPLLAFAEAGDILAPGRLETQSNVHRAWPDAVFSFSDHRCVAETAAAGGTCFAAWPLFHETVRGRGVPFALDTGALAQLFAEPVVATSTVMARTDAVQAEGGFADDLPALETWDLWLRLAQRGPVICIPQALCDCQAPAADTAASLRARVLALRMIGNRHAGVIEQMDRAARGRFHARVLQAQAEIDQLEGNHWRAFGNRLAAWSQAPTTQGWKAAGLAGWRALIAAGPPGASG
jgi:glycosyltransferase involved in cell wall biosynthesis